MDQILQLIGGIQQFMSSLGKSTTIPREIEVAFRERLGTPTIVSAVLDFPSTGAAAVSDLTINVSGARPNNPVILGVPDAAQTALCIYTAWVSSIGVVKIRFSNFSSASVNPASGTFSVAIINQS